MGNTVLYVNVLEVLQSLAGKVTTFKTPCYAMLFGALAKTGTAFHTAGHHVSGMAAVAAHFFNAKAHSLSSRFQFLDIVYPMGEIAGAVTAVNAAYPNQSPVISFHTITNHSN